jgi:hypothetical protein
MNGAHVTPDDGYPNWVRFAKRGVDWGVLFVIGVSLLLSWGFLLQDGLSQANASENYAYLTDDVAQALREGNLYPRWSAHAFAGIGAPIPHYLPPLPAYFSAALDVLFLNDSVLAVRLAFVAAFVMGGVSVYALVTRHTHARLGIFSALLYLTSPVVNVLIPHTQGNLHEAFALALSALWLWATDRRLANNHALDSVLQPVVGALLLLTSPFHAAVVLSIGLLGMASLWRARLTLRQAVSVLSISALISLSLSAFYLLPSTLERDAVHWLPTSHAKETTYLTLAQLFAPFQSPDPQILVPVPQFTLGLALWGMAFVSAGVLWRTRQWWGLHGVFLTYGTVFVLTAVAFMPSQSSWLGLIVLCYAIGGSGFWRAFPQLPDVQARLVSVLSLIGLVLLTLHITASTRPFTRMAQPNPRQQIRYEQQGFGIATNPPHFPLPSVYAPSQFSPSSALLASYQNATPYRLQSNTRLSPFVSVLNVGTHAQTYQLNGRDTLQIQLLIADFEGWQATLNQQPLRLTRDRSTYGMELTLPANANGELRVRLEETPLRRAAWGLSLFGIVSLTFAGWRARWRKHNPHINYWRLLPAPETRLLGVALAILLGLNLFAHALGLPLRPSYGSGLQQAVPLGYSTNVGLELIGYTLSSNVLRPNTSMTVTLYWRTRRLLGENYQAQWVLADVQRGQSVATTPLTWLGGLPTRRWTRENYAVDQRTLHVPSQLYGERYTLTLYVYPCSSANACDTSSSIAFFDKRGISIGTSFTLPRVLVFTP